MRVTLTDLHTIGNGCRCSDDFIAGAQKWLTARGAVVFPVPKDKLWDRAHAAWIEMAPRHECLAEQAWLMAVASAMGVRLYFWFDPLNPR